MISIVDSLCGEARTRYYHTGYFLGNVFSTYLYGALTVQLYRYYISFPRDPKPFKVVIYIVYVTETIRTVLFVYDFDTTIRRPVSFVDHSCHHIVSDPVYPIFLVLGGIANFLTQSMYAYRIRIITKLKYVPGFIILVLALQLFATVLLAISFMPGHVLFMFAVVLTSISLVVDVTITSIMVWVLKKDEIYSKRLNKKITRLIYLIIGTGFLTAATGLCALVLLLNSPELSIGAPIVASELYANSMMVLVNSRIPSARSEINHHATLDMITVQLGSINVTSQAAANAEHGQREISVDPEARGVGLSAQEAEGTTDGQLDSLNRGERFIKETGTSIM